MKHKKILILVLWLFHFPVVAQEISGTVFNEENEPLYGALIRFADTTIGGFSDENGNFTFPVDEVSLPAELWISFTGYVTDTIQVSKPKNLTITLKVDGALEEVEIIGHRSSTSIDALSAQKIEVLNAKELLKAACCNLSESFETNATVDIKYADAVTGSKQISMLGLAGKYSQINWENMPLIRGLDQYYGLSFVPGPWIESIQVGKGSGSVVNGFEGMSGNINVEFYKPDNMPKLYLNGYANAVGRSELNAFAGKSFNDKWSTAVFVHANQTRGQRDKNKDGFLDRNIGDQINLMNRWKYVGDNNLRSQFGFRYISDNRLGGQIDYDTSIDEAINPKYSVSLGTSRWEVFAKNGLIFPKKPWKSLGLILNYVDHNQDGFIGREEVNNEQTSMYANFIYQTIISDTRHHIKTGASINRDQFNENFNEVNLPREYTIPGMFVEYEYDNLNQLQLVFGLRADNITQQKDWIFSPRLHIKWNTDEDNYIRLSAGSGFRVPNIYADNPGIFVNSREVFAENDFQIEKSQNFGVSALRYLPIHGQDASLTLDFYRTNFQDQIIYNRYRSSTATYIQNLSGKSYSNSFQVGFDYEPLRRLDLRLAYKYDDVKQEVDSELIAVPFTPKHRGLINLAYASSFDRWKYDATLNIVGPQRLVSTEITPNAFQNEYFSQKYVTLGAQVTKKIKAWDIYLGAENITNFKQENPIIDPQHPFGTYFDSSSVWGPIMGRNIYVGFRMNLLKKQNHE